MLDNHYTHPRLVEIYDDENPWDGDSEFYFSLAKAEKMSILDLGCGTGALACWYAFLGHSVVAVDPSEQMLSVAKKKPFAEYVKWVCSSAEKFRTKEKFDLIVMTGHAFQVLLTDEQVEGFFKTVRNHLSEDGICVFESRSPREKPWEEWMKESSFEIVESKFGKVERSYQVTSVDGEFVSFETEYKFEDEILKSESTLRFISRHDIKATAMKAGFEVVNIQGNWRGNRFRAGDPEVIFTLKLDDLKP